MSFKVHLIIVSCIIAVVYAIWRLTSASPTPVASETIIVKESPYSIAVIHASWGLNCLFQSRGHNATEYDAFFKDTNQQDNKLREDNVLLKVSEQCNGKIQCVIPITAAALGGDPAPGCKDKVLNVEYRCFSYDRPWTVKASSGTLSINCNRQ